MKILTIFYKLEIGGAQNYTISLLNEFINQNHKIYVISLSKNNPLKERLNKKIKFLMFPRKKKIDLTVIKKLRIELSSKKYDFIISFCGIYQKFSNLFLKYKIPTLYPIHVTIPNSYFSAISVGLLFKLKRNFETYISSIDSQTEYLEKKYKLKKNYFFQILNGIDIEKFNLPSKSFDKKSILKDRGINQNHKIILMVAGFRPEKCHEVALDSFKILLTKIDNVSLVFAGDNRIEEIKKIKNLIIKKKIKNIYIFSAGDIKDIRELYWIADVFTLTSNKVETFPISSLEAMASGLPCVLTEIGGAKDIIDEKLNGKLVKPDNPISIANGWYNVILNKSFDSRKIRNNIIENYNIQKSAEKYLKIMKKNIRS